MRRPLAAGAVAASRPRLAGSRSGGAGMIWEWLLNAIADAAEWLHAQYTIMGVPDWVFAGIGYVASAMAYVSSLGNWIPFDLGGVVMLAALAAWVLGVGIKIVRIVASFLTLGGGM